MDRPRDYHRKTGKDKYDYDLCVESKKRYKINLFTKWKQTQAQKKTYGYQSGKGEDKSGVWY